MPKDQSIDQLSTQLEELINDINSENCAFETAIKKYTEALKVAQKIQKKLITNTQQITLLNEKNDTLINTLTPTK